MDMDRLNAGDLPVGFGLELAQNGDALRRFGQLSDTARADVLRRARAAGSADEMRAIVASIISQEADLNP